MAAINYTAYIRSISEELKAVNNRVAHLVDHRLSEGHFREALLRHVLKRHVPENVLVGNGFIVTNDGPSNEIDILVIDRSMPTLFKEEELLIVTPESAKAIVEVKTRLNGKRKLVDAIDELAKRKAHAKRNTNYGEVWAGLFVYESSKERHCELLGAVESGHQSHGVVINCIALGTEALLKFFPDHTGASPANSWHTFDVPGLAHPAFISSLIESLMTGAADIPQFAWFPPRDQYTPRMHLKREPGAQITDTPAAVQSGWESEAS